MQEKIVEIIKSMGDKCLIDSGVVIKFKLYGNIYEITYTDFKCFLNKIEFKECKSITSVTDLESFNKWSKQNYKG